ncbi:MAG: glycosyltransferase family A protein [Ferruginibacter sp.]
MNQPLVSILLTSYNREKYIGEAIESVLASTFKDFELIVVDDASIDNTVTIIEAYAAKDDRIKLFINERNLGDYPNRNKVAGYARGKYLKYIDSDDVMYDHCMHVMVSCMEKFPEAGFGLCSLQDPHVPSPVVVSSKTAYLEHFNGYGHFNRAPGSAIIKREVFEQIGGFSGKPLIGDNELWFKLANYYPMVKFVEGLYWDRNHGDQERFSDYAKKHYRNLRHDVMIKAMTHQDCPLSGIEIHKILNTVKKQNSKKFIRRQITAFKELFKKRKNVYDRF